MDVSVFNTAGDSPPPPPPPASPPPHTPTPSQNSQLNFVYCFSSVQDSFISCTHHFKDSNRKCASIFLVWSVCWLERERERQRQRQRQRQTDRQTDKQTDRLTDRQTDRQRDRQRARQTERETDRQTGTDRQTDREREGGKTGEKITKTNKQTKNVGSSYPFDLYANCSTLLMQASLCFPVSEQRCSSTLSTVSGACCYSIRHYIKTRALNYFKMRLIPQTRSSDTEGYRIIMNDCCVCYSHSAHLNRRKAS